MSEATDANAPEGGEGARSERPAPPREPRSRRLHALSGGLLGGFVVLHVLAQASALGGMSRYDRIVGGLERSRLSLVVVLPILVVLVFHAAHGAALFLGRAGRADGDVERYGDRRRWTAQRWSALVLLAFILVHLGEFRAQRLFFGLLPDAIPTALVAHLSWTWGGIPWVALGYLVAIGATAVHLANGLFAATAAWNIATSGPGRQRMRLVTTVLGGLLFLVGGATVVGIATGTRLLPDADAINSCGSAVPSARP